MVTEHALSAAARAGRRHIEGVQPVHTWIIPDVLGPGGETQYNEVCYFCLLKNYLFRSRMLITIAYECLIFGLYY